MKHLISTLFLFLLSYPAISQTGGLTERKSEKVEIYFDLNGYAIDSLCQENRDNLHYLSQLIDGLRSDSLTKISTIDINSYTSPEGGRIYNSKLSERRSNSIYEYLTSVVGLPDSLINKNHSGIDWDGLVAYVSESDMLYGDEVIYIIENVKEETWRRVNPGDRWLSLVDSRLKHLMELKYGNPYRYMSANIFPKLRRSSLVTIYYETTPPPPPPVVEEIEEEIVELEKVDTVETIEPTITPIVEEDARSECKSLRFAIKTNLLYDALLTPNIELEIPIGERWSVAGEWMCPWWVTKNNGNALEILSGQVEGRYWFGDRTNRPQLTGWFGGFYAGGGLYDLQLKNNGYQGEFYIAAGASAGYAHTINKKGNLRLEYSLGLGYLSTKYRYYEGKQDNEYLVWQHNGKYNWVGPTKAEISLVWFIDWKRGVKR